ncbi:MAG: hypothetical protein EPO32_14870 [Anaerolineae bacterium]|nr:MAG: hypothetical protein EPO32_14870 [Anaerolineae bacterium]
MTLTTSAILAALLHLPPAVTDRSEDPRAREARLSEVATSVSSAVSHATCLGAWDRIDCRRIWGGEPVVLAGAVLALGYGESHYAAYVGEDRCHDGPRGARCDNGKARGYWQAWAVAAPDLHALPVGAPERVRVAAWAATRLLVGAYGFCDRDWAGAFGRYGGASCRSNRPDSARKVRTMWALVRELRRHSAEEPLQPWPAEPPLPPSR